MTQPHIATTTLSLSYPYTPESLTEQLELLRGHSFTLPALYKDGVKAIARCREFRVAIEARRKLLKEDSIKYGREVDRVAKVLTEMVLAIEQPLKEAKLLVDNEKERLKREAAEAERKAKEAEIRAAREAEEAVLREQRKAEEAQLTEQRRELEKLRAEMAKDAAELKARQNEERRLHEEALQKHAAELVEIKAKRETAEREQAARELAERLAAEAEEQRINRLEYEEANRHRLAALQPDIEKLQAWAKGMRQLAESAPSVKDTLAKEAVAAWCADLLDIATDVYGYKQ
jgi:hypothetical protein